MSSRLWLVILALASLIPAVALAEDQPKAADSRPKRVLLLGQKPDSHPANSHEYMAGVRLIAKLLQNRGGLQTVVVQADNPWRGGPELLDGADGAVVFLTEGAKWVTEDADRLASFQSLAKRGGGLSVLHWGLGTREAAPVVRVDPADLGGCFPAAVDRAGPSRRFSTNCAGISSAPSAPSRCAEISASRFI